MFGDTGNIRADVIDEVFGREINILDNGEVCQSESKSGSTGP